ncbi:hypothetical protein EYR38_009444 [Pleurotus pulmonarius]|nr:hypothetical protein EYR38_009444 [Pleurotus pulmonarius]
MDRLCDEILQLVFYELNDPTPLTLVSKRFHHFSQDNFIRAHYFLARYGETQALFYALGRGRILNERVLNTLLASGAHMSRYLVQLAIHHYFRSQGHFIKTTWVRSVPLPVFVYFMKLASEKYGEIPVGKNEDDGSIFATFLRESRFHPSVRTTNWEAIKDILEKYKFLPFTNKDPIMAQFPLALAIEPRLLPLAVANGFQMDSKYRDFVFRKMFERPIASSDTRADDIVRNARELCRLDPTMFLSRTVAAEVCMEAKTNEAAYLALQRLDKAGELRFDLSTLVEELIKLFATTRSIALNSVALTLRQLYADFPSEDYIARHVLLCSIFIQEGFNCSHAHASYPFTANTPHLPTTENLKLRFDELALGKGPTRLELMAVLLNPFVERFTPVMEWIRWDGRRIVRTEDVEDTSIGSSSASNSSVPRSKDRATRRESDNLPERSGAVGLGLDTVGAKDFIQEVVEKMLEVACKGKMIKRMFERYDYVRETIAKVVLEKHQIDVDDLPPWDDEDACRRYHAKLSRDYTMLDSSTGRESLQLVQQMQPSLPPEVKPDDEGEGCEGHGMGNTQSEPELGHIGQDTLSVMIRQDETAPSRSRRRAFYMYNYANDSANKLPYPNDPLSVGRWVKTQFGTQSRITAVFLTHAIINDNAPDINYFFGYVDAHVPRPEARAVPLTFKHFQLLARLGRAPNWTLYNELERGAEFYYSEDDYLSDTVVIPLKQGSTLTYKIKKEASKTILTQHDPTSASRGTKRPRREAASTTRSYVVPDSDDEAIIGESDDEWMDDDLLMKNMQQQCQKKAETNLQKWIVHLTALCKDEERKYKGKKRSLDKAGKIEARARIQKNDFLRSLSAQLRHLRKVDHDRRLSLYGPEYADLVYSDEDDEEYIDKTTVRHQRRKISRD